MNDTVLKYVDLAFDEGYNYGSVCALEEVWDLYAELHGHDSGSYETRGDEFLEKLSNLISIYSEKLALSEFDLPS